MNIFIKFFLLILVTTFSYGLNAKDVPKLGYYQFSEDYSDFDSDLREKISAFHDNGNFKEIHGLIIGHAKAGDVSAKALLSYTYLGLFFTNNNDFNFFMLSLDEVEKLVLEGYRVDKLTIDNMHEIVHFYSGLLSFNLVDLKYVKDRNFIDNLNRFKRAQCLNKTELINEKLSLAQSIKDCFGKYKLKK